jgi:hypothetical protein
MVPQRTGRQRTVSRHRLAYVIIGVVVLVVFGLVAGVREVQHFGARVVAVDLVRGEGLHLSYPVAS